MNYTDDTNLPALSTHEHAAPVFTDEEFDKLLRESAAPELPNNVPQTEGAVDHQLISTAFKPHAQKHFTNKLPTKAQGAEIDYEAPFFYDVKYTFVSPDIFFVNTPDGNSAQSTEPTTPSGSSELEFESQAVSVALPQTQTDDESINMPFDLSKVIVNSNVSIPNPQNFVNPPYEPIKDSKRTSRSGRPISPKVFFSNDGETKSSSTKAPYRPSVAGKAARAKKQAEETPKGLSDTLFDYVNATPDVVKKGRGRPSKTR